MSNEITNAVDVLKSGGIILYPTDTIWGIGCDACCDTAVKKVYKIMLQLYLDLFTNKYEASF